MRASQWSSLNVRRLRTSRADRKAGFVSWSRRREGVEGRGGGGRGTGVWGCVGG